MPPEKVTTKGHNQKVTTSENGCNPKKSTQKQDLDVYLTVKEGCNLLGISQQALSKRIKKNKYQTRQVHGNGGLRYEIALHSLGVAAQKRYWEGVATEKISSGSALLCETNNTAQGDREDGHLSAPASLSEDDAKIYLTLEEYNREIADRNLEILDAVGSRKGKEAKAFLEAWCLDNPEKKVSYKTWQRLRTQYKRGGIAAIAGKHGKRKGTTTIRPKWYQTFVALYLDRKTGQESAYSCWELVAGKALKDGEIEKLSDFPSYNTFYRKLKDEPEQVKTYIRDGKDVWKKQHSYSIDSDLDTVLAGDVYVGDHRKLDVFVAMPDGKLVRPWISMISDFKSGMFLGWDIFVDNPNGDKIIMCLKRAFENGGIPKTLLFDNGKDYRRQDIAGGRIGMKNTSELVQTWTPTITGVLGIEVKFAIPYNSQSKPIERLFGIMANYFDKHMKGYTGPDGKKRPDGTRKAEKQMSKIRKVCDEETQKNIKLPVMTFDEFQPLMNQFIQNYNIRAFRAGKKAGQSPVMVWNKDRENAPVMRVPTASELGILCASTGKPVRVNRNCLRDSRSGKEYFSPWMVQYEGSKKHFFLRIDPENPHHAYCFEANIDHYDTKTGEPVYTIGKFINVGTLKPQVGYFNNDPELENESEIKWGVAKTVEQLAKAVGGEHIDGETRMNWQHIYRQADHETRCEAAGLDTEISKPVVGQLTPFSHVPAEIERKEKEGIWDTDIVAPETQEKPKKLIRFLDIDEED